MATPSRLSGPWDSRGVTDRPIARVGLHLNELTVRDMIALAAANRMRPLAFAVKEKRPLQFRHSVHVWAGLHEGLASMAPRAVRKRLCRLAVLLAEAN
jgi:hypothetical protein